MSDHQRRHNIDILLIDIDGQRSVPDFKTVSVNEQTTPIRAVPSSSLLASRSSIEAEQRMR